MAISFPPWRWPTLWRRGTGPTRSSSWGRADGLDALLLAGEGLPVTLLPGHGITRHLDARSWWKNIGAVVGLLAAWAAAVVVVIRRRPSVVVAMGGYACVPTALAAAMVGIPVVLVNVDAVPGAANRLVGRFARAAAVAFDGTALPRAVVTGAPVRPSIVAAARPDGAARSKAREALGLPVGRVVVGAVGGSLGSKRLNEAVIGLAELWAGRGDVAIYHVVGRRDWSWASNAGERITAADADGLRYIQVPFEDHMELFYQAADIVVARAGANTVAELAVVGVPAILVPLPGAPDDHQRANAGVLERAGGAVVVSDPECTGPRLATEIDSLAADRDRLPAMGAAAAAVGRPDAVSAVAALARSHARAARPRTTPSVPAERGRPTEGPRR